MFERYTERARRVIFFGRQEASNFGSRMIETEHLLLGLLHEDKKLVARFQPESWAGASIREELKKRSATLQEVPISVDMPLSLECKRILAYAAEEAHRLRHNHIGTEHLLLGMLREERCVAAEILRDRGLNLEAIRKELARLPEPVEPPTAFTSVIFRPQNTPELPKAGIVPDGDTAKKIAEVIWTPLYGSETVASQSPLKAELHNNVWTVTGSSALEKALFAFILMTDGRILSLGRGPVRG